MPMGGKPLAALIVGRKPAAGGKPAAEPAPAPQDAGPDGAALDVAQSLIDAIHAKDPHATAAALEAYCSLHESGSPDSGEPADDEGLPPAS